MVVTLCMYGFMINAARAESDSYDEMLESDSRNYEIVTKVAEI